MSLYWISLFGTVSALMYVVVLFSLGWATWQNGRHTMFFVGFLLPIFWIVGGLMSPLPGSPGEQKFVKRYDTASDGHPTASGGEEGTEPAWISSQRPTPLQQPHLPKRRQR